MPDIVVVAAKPFFLFEEDIVSLLNNLAASEMNMMLPAEEVIWLADIQAPLAVMVVALENISNPFGEDIESQGDHFAVSEMTMTLLAEAVESLEDTSKSSAENFTLSEKGFNLLEKGFGLMEKGVKLLEKAF